MGAAQPIKGACEQGKRPASSLATQATATRVNYQGAGS
jgi:hypothetical protein